MLPRVAPPPPPSHHHHRHTLHAINAQHFALTPPAADPNSMHSVVEITRQPPESWYKDQFGRKATFEVAVRRVARGCGACADQRHLNVQLLYESGKPVENQNILRVASGLCLNKDDQSTLAIRIMEVSKNHQNQRFRLQISLPTCPLKHLGAAVAGVMSEPVLVLSKKNKRPVKSDAEEAAENKTVLKLKKSKHVSSPNNSINEVVDPFGTPTSRPRVAAESPPEFEELREEGQWGAEIVRFHSPNQGLCLWANAAFNFMHRLQWQNRLENTHEDDAKYQCPSCRATYTSRPAHRPECDLALLLEQTGSIDDSHSADKSDKRSQLTREQSCHSLQEPSGHHHSIRSSARPSISSSKHNHFINKDDVSPPSIGLGSTSVDLLAKNLNLGSWEGYSSLSKIMFSLEAGIKHPVDVNTSLRGGSKDHKSSDVSMNSLMSGGGGWSFATPPQTGQLSLNLSSLLSSVKGLSPDTAAFLQEQEAELTGDASLLRSLSKVSLSDFLPDGNSDRLTDGCGEDLRSAVTSLANVLTDESKSSATENAVMTIASVDFHNCGYPAFDSSNALVGSYFLSEKKTQPELRFLPNLYPLPPQMLQDLETSLVTWRQKPNILVHARSDTNGQSLSQLKTRVVEALTAQRSI